MEWVSAELIRMRKEKVIIENEEILKIIIRNK